MKFESIPARGTEISEDPVEKWKRKLEAMGLMEENIKNIKAMKLSLKGIVNNFLSENEETVKPLDRIGELSATLTSLSDFEDLAQAAVDFVPDEKRDICSKRLYMNALVYAEADAKELNNFVRKHFVDWIRWKYHFVLSIPDTAQDRLEHHPDDPDSLEFAADIDAESIDPVRTSPQGILSEKKEIGRAVGEYTKALELLKGKADYRTASPTEHIQELQRKLEIAINKQKEIDELFARPDDYNSYIRAAENAMERAKKTDKSDSGLSWIDYKEALEQFEIAQTKAKKYFEEREDRDGVLPYLDKKIKKLKKPRWF